MQLAANHMVSEVITYGVWSQSGLVSTCRPPARTQLSHTMCRYECFVSNCFQYQLDTAGVGESEAAAPHQLDTFVSILREVRGDFTRWLDYGCVHTTSGFDICYEL